MKKGKGSPPPQFRTLKAAGDFWDTHSLADYWKWTRPAAFEVKLSGSHDRVVIEGDLATAIRRTARRRGVTVQRLVNRWLREKTQAAAGKAGLRP